jgi:hypothetical protein
VLDRGDQPDVRVVEERLEIRPAKGLARLAVSVDRLADRRQVDRSKIADEARVSGTQPDLRSAPRLVVGLSPENIPDGVAGRDESTDDSGVLRRNPVTTLAVAHRDELGDALDNLHEIALVKDVAPFLDRCAFGGGADAQRHGHRLFHRESAARPEEIGWQAIEGVGKLVFERADGREHRLAGVDRPIGARRARMAPKDHLGVVEEVAVDRQRRVGAFRPNGLGKRLPHRAAGRRARIRFCRKRMSTTTSVPAAACIAPCGMRTAPIRSAMEAI